MATHDYVLANASGSSFRSDLNNALAAIVSQNSSATEPATTFSYQYWIDTSVTPALLKQRNAANDAWITLAEVGGQTLADDGTAAKPGISFAADTNTGIRRVEDNKIGFITDGTERLTIDTSGIFEFSGNIINGTPDQGVNAFAFKTNAVMGISRNVGSSSNVIKIYGANGQVHIKGDGDLVNTNNNYGAISDSKLKENIVDASSQWDDIKGIQVRNYNFKEDTGLPTHTQIGFVAQELETVCPGLVTDAPDEDADGNQLATTTKSVSYSVLYVKAVKALQEAMARIETLETKVAALEAAN